MLIYIYTILYYKYIFMSVYITKLGKDKFFIHMYNVL